MQTIFDPSKLTDNEVSGFEAAFPPHPSPANQIKKLKIKEFISWSISFAIISVLTGFMKYMKVGITMDSVTTALFYGSLGGFIYFMIKIVQLSKTPAPLHPHSQQGLN